MDNEKSNLIGTMNLNGFNITLIHHEGTNVIGSGERYAVNSLSEHGTSILEFKYLVVALDQFNKEITHAFNMGNETYKAYWKGTGERL